MNRVTVLFDFAQQNQVHGSFCCEMLVFGSWTTVLMYSPLQQLPQPPLRNHWQHPLSHVVIRNSIPILPLSSTASECVAEWSLIVELQICEFLTGKEEHC